MAAAIVYSPVKNMDASALEANNLKTLKYTQLLKLAHKYNIKKRWAKKDELIQSLLKAKEKLLESNETRDNTVNEEIEWTDGGEMFKDIKPLSFEEQDKNGRTTFTLEKKEISRETYNLNNAINDVLPNFSSLNSRLTFDIPKKEKKTTIVSSTERFVPKVKQLTVPYSRPVPRKPVNRPSTIRESPLKLSNKSITIKKAKSIMSPLKTSRSSPTRAATRTSLSRSILTPHQSQIGLLRNQTTQKGTVVKSAVTSTSLVRRKSKSDDPNLRRVSLKTSAAVAFRSPQSGVNGSSSTAKKIATETDRLGSGAKSTSSTTSRPRVTRKIPDFASIHKKQFDKMDSLDEYINKKAERVKKLFGTPMVVRPTEKLPVSKNGPITQRFLTEIKENKIDKQKKFETTPVKVKLLEARKIMNRNPTLRAQTDVKDKNRSHIHGYRTNKRFELQMKMRNL